MASSAPNGAGPSEAHINRGNGAGMAGTEAMRYRGACSNRPSEADTNHGATGWGGRGYVLPCEFHDGARRSVYKSGGGGGGQGEAHLPKGAKGWEARRTC